MIPLAEARASALGVCPPPAVVTLPLAEALGCVLAEPAAAAVAIPPFANSAMDGYAVRAEDVAGAPVTLEVTGRVLAGADASSSTVGRGQALRIMTGAPVPAGADAVCMVELTHPAGGAGDTVVIEAPVASGVNIRPAGDDVAAGQLVLDAGARIGPTQLGALISAGCAEVRVHPAPRVGVISTGDELTDPGAPLGPAQIYDSNRPMLLALVAGAGCRPVDLGRAPDEEAALTERIEGALGDVDALVLSGGVSVGDVDLVKVVLDRLAHGTGQWMQIAIRPAKPFSCAALAGPGGRTVPAFGLPGNPVSSAVSFELLVRPALLGMAGRKPTGRPRVRAVAAAPFGRHPDGKVHFDRVLLTRRGDLDGEWLAQPARGQSSHQIGSLAASHGLAVVPDGDGLDEGDRVEVVVTDESVLGTT
ncbi:MAG: molybdopterin molybdotransferase MoeA [Acidimicrobiales bacterium]